VAMRVCDRYSARAPVKGHALTLRLTLSFFIPEGSRIGDSRAHGALAEEVD